jgi:hypothetical protein
MISRPSVATVNSGSQVPAELGDLSTSARKDQVRPWSADIHSRSIILRVLPASSPIDASHNKVGIAPIGCGSSNKVWQHIPVLLSGSLTLPNVGERPAAVRAVVDRADPSCPRCS